MFQVKLESIRKELKTTQGMNMNHKVVKYEQLTFAYFSSFHNM